MCGCFPAAGALFRSLSNHPPFELEPKGSAGMSPWAATTPRPSTATNSRLLGVAGSIIDSLVYSPTTTKKLGGLLLLLLLLHPDQRRAVFSFDGWNRTRAASENRRRFAQAPVRLSFANCPATKNQGYINSASIL